MPVTRFARGPWIAVLAVVALLSVGGYFGARAIAHHDEHAAAARRAAVDRMRAELVLERAKGRVVGLGQLLAGEPNASQERFAFVAGATITGFDLVDTLWIERASDRLVARYATTIPPGTDVSRWSALAGPIEREGTVFAIASGVSELHGSPGLWLLESARFGRGAGYLAVFVPRGWLTLSLADDPARVEVVLGGRKLEGRLATAAATSTAFQALGQNWRILVTAPPAGTVDASLPWLALGWPWAAGLLAFMVGSATVRRRRAEHEVERIFDLSLDLLGIATYEDVFTHVNPAFTRTLGYSAQELTSRPFFQFAHPDDRARSREALAQVVSGEELVQFENRYVRKDGSVCWLEWSVHPVPAERRLYAAARDITARREAEEHLRQTQVALRASSGELRRLVDEHAAVRRVATLVAHSVTAAEVFGAVVREVRSLLGADGARLTRAEPDESTTVLAADGELDWRSSATAPIVVEGARWGMLEAGWQRQRPVSPVAAARLRQFTDLAATAIANAHSRAELNASRARVVAAADAARRRIERDLHDGTQQRLVALTLALRVAETQIPENAPELREQLGAVAEGLADAVADLQELSRGIHPVLLSRRGLEPALRALARRSSLPVEIEAQVPGRLPEPVEVAVYYVISEALTNAAKHATPTRVQVSVQTRASAVEVEVRDDGVGGADPSRGSGLLGLLDRVQALGGTLKLSSTPKRGTTLRATLPLADGALNASSTGAPDDASPAGAPPDPSPISAP